MFGCQQELIKCNKETKSIIEYLCFESNSLYNCSVYYARQIWLKTGKIVSGFDLTVEIKTNRHFNAGYASAMQQTCLNVGEAFQSFKKLLAKSKKGELDQKPKAPNYRKPGGLFTVTYPKRWLKLKDGFIRFPLGNQVKAWFGISEFFLPVPSNLEWSEIKEIRLLPRNRCFYAEFVYKTETAVVKLDKSKVLGIDHGLNNWLTCVSNVGTSFIVDGLHLKSLNQWYNKSVAKIKENKPQGFWSNRLAAITEKRNRQMRSGVNKAARIVITHCIENKIGSIVFGWNVGQKNSANMGVKTNQKFVQIPTAKLKNRIEQLCDQYGIEFIETEESYTSKTSFLDHDALPKYGEKPDGWKSSGRRLTRGIYQSFAGIKINADCNGASNILRKVSVMLGLDLSGISRGALSAPKKVLLWTLQKSPRLQTGEA
ncbi:IS200/IS605 family element transposase accessory protein TnpB [Anabaena minutissima FACHB-250]|nr:IS200/IS605 family element transposase accessory protein TnpB [Anabaena minutissima FACHB-250]